MSLKAVLKFNLLTFDEFENNSHSYSTQICSSCQYKNREALRGRVIADNHGTCGIHTCTNDASFFVDFKDYDFVYIDVVPSLSRTIPQSSRAKKFNFAHITSNTVSA